MTPICTLSWYNRYKKKFKDTHTVLHRLYITNYIFEENILDNLKSLLNSYIHTLPLINMPA